MLEQDPGRTAYLKRFWRRVESTIERDEPCNEEEAAEYQRIRAAIAEAVALRAAADKRAAENRAAEAKSDKKKKDEKRKNKANKKAKVDTGRAEGSQR